MFQISALTGFINLMYLSVGDFKFATCIPDACNYGDGALNTGVMWSSFNATAVPMVKEAGSDPPYSDIDLS